MLTDKYLADSEDKSSIHRLLQISQNRKVKTRIVNAETPTGKRISQFGGIVFFIIPTKQREYREEKRTCGAHLHL